ncbi:hypothetical protein P9112_000542 [Eukaryota sp. TZLM1-RC]
MISPDEDDTQVYDEQTTGLRDDSPDSEYEAEIAITKADKMVCDLTAVPSSNDDDGHYFATSFRYFRSPSHKREVDPWRLSHGCYVCGREGHMWKDCPINTFGVLDLEATDYCYKCGGQHGEMPCDCSDDFPELYCIYCKGMHYCKQCSNRPAFNRRAFCLCCGKSNHVIWECYFA